MMRVAAGSSVRRSRFRHGTWNTREPSDSVTKGTRDRRRSFQVPVGNAFDSRPAGGPPADSFVASRGQDGEGPEDADPGQQTRQHVTRIVRVDGHPRESDERDEHRDEEGEARP